VEVAYGSLMEVVSESRIASRQSFLVQSQFEQIYSDAEKIGRMLSGLRNTLTGTSG
jgi:four helix bundle protein